MSCLTMPILSANTSVVNVALFECYADIHVDDDIIWITNWQEQKKIVKKNMKYKYLKYVKG